MSWLRSILGSRLSSDRADLRVGQYFCFAAAPLLLLVALYAVAKYAATPGEALIGLLTSLAVALLLVILGIVLPLARDKQ